LDFSYVFSNNFLSSINFLFFWCYSSLIKFFLQIALGNILKFRKKNWQFDIIGGFIYFVLSFSMFPQVCICLVLSVSQIHASYPKFWFVLIATAWQLRYGVLTFQIHANSRRIAYGSHFPDNYDVFHSRFLFALNILHPRRCYENVVATFMLHLLPR
jgi:hypothetical protein